MIQDLQLSVCGQIIEPMKCKLVQNTTNEYRLIFSFDSSWSDLTKTVILKNVGESRFKIEDDGSAIETVLDSNNSVIIPAQLLRDSGYIAVTVKGLSSDMNELRLTEKYNRYIYVDAQGDYEGDEPEEFKQSLYTQILTIATNTSLLRDDLEAKKQADYWRGEKGNPFTYADFTQEQLNGLKVKGDKGDPFVYSDFTQEQLNGLKVKGDKGDAFTYADFTQEQIDGLKVKGDKGDAFTYTDFTQDQLDALKVKGDKGEQGIQGEKGDPFVYSDFTEEQLNTLKVKGDKGDKGDPFVYSDFTEEQLNALKVKGDKGDKGADGVVTFESLTEEQKASLKGDKGDDGETYDDTEVRSLISEKVNKAEGKGLSTNDYDDDAKAKVDAIPSDPKYTDTVYNDAEIRGLIDGKQDTLTAADKQAIADLHQDPTIPTKVSDLTNDSGFITNAYHDITKQDTINDLETIRSGATAGLTALQPDDISDWAKAESKPTYTASEVGAVPTTRTVNSKALSSNITLTASDVSAVPTTRTINGKALSSDITLTASNVSAVPTTRTVNGKALSSNITLTASDVSAAPAYTYGTDDMTAGSSTLATGTLYFVYE